MWPLRDSNTQPSDLESDALPLRQGVLVACSFAHLYILFIFLIDHNQLLLIFQLFLHRYPASEWILGRNLDIRFLPFCSIRKAFCITTMLRASAEFSQNSWSHRDLIDILAFCKVEYENMRSFIRYHINDIIDDIIMQVSYYELSTVSRVDPFLNNIYWEVHQQSCRFLHKMDINYYAGRVFKLMKSNNLFNLWWLIQLIAQSALYQ